MAQDLVPEAPSAILLDQLSGRVLFQKHADLPVPPASLTKLMTLHLAWKELETGQIHPQDLVPVTAETTGASVPPGSSLMFLEPGQLVTVKEIMLGLAVDSGNDAGMTLARFLGGSQEAFVAAMNTEARALGLNHTVFFDSYGYDARNLTTAEDYARFSRFYLSAHPQAVPLIHSVRQLAFPLDANRAPGDKRKARTVLQSNRNTLLEAYPGADGLKTGYIDESGYNLAATAVRNDQRLVAVILGIKGRNEAEGGRLRTAVGIRLLDFGFTSYPLRPLPLPAVPAVRVWFASPGTVVPAPSGPTIYPLATGELSGIEARIDALSEVEGPVPSGTVLGRIVWMRGGKEFYSLDLKTVASADRAPWWTGLWDRIVLFFRGLTGVPSPKPVVLHT
jgi:D-alanyl-D-alanine carboxypeptidase (penicillin-binding protein 5/6)